MEKIKRIITNGVEGDKGKDILTLFIIILVGLGSFGLGRMSKTTSSTDSGISVEYPTSVDSLYGQEANAIAPTNNKVDSKTSTTPKNTSGSYFASSRGSKYYSIGCSGGKTLKEENKIYFASKEEAEKAGYELSSTCK